MRHLQRNGERVLTASWRALAACASADPDLFIGPVTETARERRSRVTQAKAVCRACPVRHQCLSYAIREGETDGVWGGTDEKERRPVPVRILPASEYCGSGRHVKAMAGTLADGRCRECNRESCRRRNPPSGLGRGVTGEYRTRNQNGRFAAPADRDQAA